MLTSHLIIMIRPLGRGVFTGWVNYPILLLPTQQCTPNPPSFSGTILIRPDNNRKTNMCDNMTFATFYIHLLKINTFMVFFLLRLTSFYLRRANPSVPTMTSTASSFQHGVQATVQSTGLGDQQPQGATAMGSQ